MIQLSISLDPNVVQFYKRVADNANLSLERVLSDALFRLAGELSLQSLKFAGEGH